MFFEDLKNIILLFCRYIILIPLNRLVNMTKKQYLNKFLFNGV